MATKSTKTKATAAKKTTPKKPTKVTKVSKKSAKPVTQSQFMEARVTDQTVYWMIFGAAAIVFALWLFSLDAKVRDLYDQIDMNTYNSDVVPAPTDTTTVAE